MSKLKLNNWRSTLAGVAMILSALAHLHTLSDLAKPELLGQLAGGIGLIASADASKAAKQDTTPTGE